MVIDLKRIILHIDMDAFFASVEQRDDDSLKGRPVIIGADPKEGKGRGVVSTCSYEARKYGVRSAMPISIAYKKCPHGAFLRPDMEKYLSVSTCLESIFYDISPKVEMISVDEAFIDITGAVKLFGGERKLALFLKERVYKKCGVTASVGIGSSKLIAKVASDYNKPDGLTQVPAGDEKMFLADLPIGVLPGIGKKTQINLKAKGYEVISQLQLAKAEDLSFAFGDRSAGIIEYACGIDRRPVEATNTIKSVSNEYTFDCDTASKSEIMSVLMFLSEKVSYRLRLKGLEGRNIAIKLRGSDFSTYTRQKTLTEKIWSVGDIFEHSQELVLLLLKQKRMKVRLLGVKVAGFEDVSIQADLFETKSEKNVSLDSTVVDIKRKFGFDSILRARTISEDKLDKRGRRLG